jgi:hypothetical protein
MAKKVAPHTNIQRKDSFWEKVGVYKLAGRRGIDPGTEPLYTEVPGAVATRPAKDRTYVSANDAVHLKSDAKGPGANIKVKTSPITVRGNTRKTKG